MTKTEHYCAQCMDYHESVACPGPSPGDPRPVAQNMQVITTRVRPKQVSVYQSRDYVAVCIVREGGTPEWHVSRVVDGELQAVPPDEAEDVAMELLP